MCWPDRAARLVKESASPRRRYPPLSGSGAGGKAQFHSSNSRPLARAERIAMSDLIVIGYPDEETAGKVWEELVRLEKDYLIDLEDAAIIRRDSKGRLHVTTPAHHALASCTVSGLFWGTLIGVLLLFPIAPLVGVAGGLMGAALCTAGRLGSKDEFK